MMRAVLKLQDNETQTEWTKSLGEPQQSAAAIAKRTAEELHSGEAHIESIADRFRKRIRELSLTSQDMADLEGLVNGNSPKAEMLADVFSYLQVLGINVEIPSWMKVADLSSETGDEKLDIWKALQIVRGIHEQDGQEPTAKTD